MRIVISSAHGKYVPGAVGPSPWGLNEVTESRKVVDRAAAYMRAAGNTVYVFHDDTSHSQNENLNAIVDFHNAHDRDLDVSIHFNSNVTTNSPIGTECWYLTQEDLADDVTEGIHDASGLKNRGGKETDDLFFLNNTEEPAILVEVCFVDSKADCDLYRQNFEDICASIAATVTGDEMPISPPDPTPPGQHPTLGIGDDGPAVVELQTKLGCLVPDGDFGPTTDTWVRAFQGACGLSVDGIVGNKTWAQVDALQDRVDSGEPPLSKALADQIWTMAVTSEIADYSWRDRGVAPPGYIPGMALSFAYAMTMEHTDAIDVLTMAQGSPSTDALAWYEPEFRALGMRNDRMSIETMRHLFALAVGLGPRESSGRYCEGRDLSASNVQSDTAEAGVFQTSWNIRAGSSAIPPLLPDFWGNPNGFLSQFKTGVTATANNLNSYGSGDGIRYQFLSRFCPLFHVLVTAVGMRTLRQHWGPLNRREVELKREADDLLREVQRLVESEA